MRNGTYQALSKAVRAKLVAVGAKAAFLASGRVSQWERDADTREYWTRCLQDVFEHHGFDEDVEVLAHAAFERFGYVAQWASSPKAQHAWIRRMGIAVDAINEARANGSQPPTSRVGWASAAK